MPVILEVNRAIFSVLTKKFRKSLDLSSRHMAAAAWVRKDTYLSLAASYVVFADERSNGRFYVRTDSGTRPMSEALALLPQLRAFREGQRVASLFGVLRSAEEPDYSASGVLLGPPLKRTRLQLINAARSLSAVTDVNGSYAFYEVPAAEYRIAVSLPPSTELLNNIDKESLRPIDLRPRACQEYDISVLPTGRIRGRVLGADGKPLRFTPVALFRASQYTAADEASAWWDFNQSEGFFEFSHLAPGDYVLVFNHANRLSPGFPYPRTFYPGTLDLSRAARIHLRPGHQVLSADIHLTNPHPTRELTLRLVPAGSETLLTGLNVDIVPSDESIPPVPRDDAPGIIKLSLLRNARYTIRAMTYCSATSTTHTRWQTDTVEVDGGDDSVSEITLTKVEQPCRN